MMGFNTTVTFIRKGKRVIIKKARRGKLPQKQIVKKEEIIKFLETKFKVNMR